jgi:hypothetical protein
LTAVLPAILCVVQIRCMAQHVRQACDMLVLVI